MMSKQLEIQTLQFQSYRIGMNETNPRDLQNIKQYFLKKKGDYIQSFFINVEFMTRFF